MTTPSINNAGSSIGIQDASMMTSLDNDANNNSVTFDGNFVMAFAKLRLQALDSWLSRTQNSMDLATKRTEALNAAAAVVAQYIQGFSDGSAQNHADIQNKFRDAASKLPDGDAVKDKLLWLANDPQSPLNTTADPNRATEIDDRVSGEEMGALQKQIEGMMKSIDSNSQLESMQVNQKMGERGEVLQLASTLIQMLNESNKNIISHLT